MERQEMETVKIWNVSSAGLRVCVRSRGMREVSKERAAWEHSLEKNKKVLIGRRRGEKGAYSRSCVCKAWCLEQLGRRAGQRYSHCARWPRALNYMPLEGVRTCPKELDNRWRFKKSFLLSYRKMLEKNKWLFIHVERPGWAELTG